MKTNVYSVFDSKAAVYGTPFFMPNDNMAIRAFSDLVNGPENMISKHPEDFSLFVVGTFDDQLAKLEGRIAPLNLVTASSLKRVNRFDISTPEKAAALRKELIDAGVNGKSIEEAS